MARKPKYRPKTMPRLAAERMREGYTNAMLASYFHVCVDTITEWTKRYPEFSDALKEGRDYTDRQVENALLKRAMGYDYDEVEIVGDESKPRRVRKVKKHVPPDTTAGIFWLKNRRPHEWRDRHDVTLHDLTDEELVAEAGRIVAARTGDPAGGEAAQPGAADGSAEPTPDAG